MSLVSQLTVDRLSNLRRLTEHWDGHISVAIYVLNDKDIDEIKKLRQSSTRVRNYVDFHLVYGDEVKRLFSENSCKILNVL